MSSDIAHFIVSEFRRHKLRVNIVIFIHSLSGALWANALTTCNFLQLFKMEDVSMGMWVEKFNSTKPVEYVHNVKFCQFGCIVDYYTAHYQSPRQMMCMWDKLQEQARPQCCDMR